MKKNIFAKSETKYPYSIVLQSKGKILVVEGPPMKILNKPDKMEMGYEEVL